MTPSQESDTRRVVELAVRTCDACPSQWECWLEDGNRLYVRYRHGVLSWGVGETGTDAVHQQIAALGRGTSYPIEPTDCGLRQVPREGDGYMNYDEMADHMAVFGFVFPKRDWGWYS